MARELGVPVIVGAIGSDLRRRNDPITVRRVRETMIGADAVITVSEELRQQAILQGVPADRVTAILNDDLDHVSTDLLIRILASLGYRVKVSVVRSESAA